MIDTIFLFDLYTAKTKYSRLFPKRHDKLVIGPDTAHISLYHYCADSDAFYQVDTVVPLLRDHKPQKWSLKRGMPHLMGNQELKPLVSVPNYPPNKASLFYHL